MCKKAPLDGLRWRLTRGELYVFNGSKHAIYVSLGDGISACDKGVGGVYVYQITVETSLVTLSYYTDSRDLMSIFLRDDGNWTASLTPMVPPSCYTMDRWDGVTGSMALARRRVCCGSYANRRD
jgi:hypothetical protein